VFVHSVCDKHYLYKRRENQADMTYLKNDERQILAVILYE